MAEGVWINDRTFVVTKKRNIRSKRKGVQEIAAEYAAALQVIAGRWPCPTPLHRDEQCSNCPACVAHIALGSF